MLFCLFKSTLGLHDMREFCNNIVKCGDIDFIGTNKNILKGQFTPKIHIFSLTCRAINQSRLIWCELSSFGDIGLFSNIMGLNSALSTTKIHLKTSNVSFQKSWPCYTK